MSAVFTSTFATAPRASATPASLTVALSHTINWLLAPLESVYSPATLTALAEALHVTLTPRLAKHWTSPSRAARVISLSPASLPPKAIVDAFAATGTNWQLAVHMRASGSDFDLFVDPGCVSVSIAGAARHLTIWSEVASAAVLANKPSTHELLAFDDDDELFSLIDKQLLSSTRSSLSGPSGPDASVLGHDQLADMLSLFPSVPPPTSTAFPKYAHLSAFHSRTTSTSSSVPSLSHSRSSSATSNSSFGPHSRSSSSSSLAEKNPHYNVNHPALLRLKARDEAQKAQEHTYDFLPPRLVLPIPIPRSHSGSEASSTTPFTPGTPPSSTGSSPYSARTIPSPMTPLSALSHSNSSSSSLESIPFAAVVTPATPTTPCAPKATVVAGAGAGDAASASKPKRSRRARVQVDNSRVTPTRYEGGRTTVLTGGTMLGIRSN